MCLDKQIGYLHIFWYASSLYRYVEFQFFSVIYHN